MMRSASLFLALTSLALIAARAAERPRYGGTLRVETRASLAVIDPAQWPADAAQARLEENLLNLISDRLVCFDETGRPQPALLLNWERSLDGKRWTFDLRSGVKFHDGTPLTRADVAAIIARANAKWRVTSLPSNRDGFAISSDVPLPDLPAELAAARYSILRHDERGVLQGTGPFRLAEWQPGLRAVVAANDGYWGGRPFLDSVEIAMGRAPREQLIDLELGRADLIEVLPDQVRRAVQGKTRVWSSRPSELLALVFDRASGRASEDEHLRMALALSIDRAALHDVLLQKQGEASGGLLPQWLSGYAFLFPIAAEPERARQLWFETAAPPLTLVDDSSDPLARSVAERIAVNARAAGIPLQISSTTGTTGTLRLIRLRIESPEPRRALLDLASALGITERANLTYPATPEQLYAAERALLAENRVIPLVALPETYGLGPQVRDWMASPVPGAGGWRLDEVWLERESQ